MLASLGGSALTVATTRSFQRGSAMLQAGLPKAARFGREGFAAHLGRVLAARGIMPLDPEPLRLLDRVNCVVFDVDLLLRGDFELTTAAVVGSADSEDPERMVRRLFDRRHPAARRRRGGWTLAPARATGTRAHASTVAMTSLVAAQLGQTLVVGGRDPVVHATGLGSAVLLTGIVQTPGLSHFFGCRPLGPLGWGISAAASSAATAGAFPSPRSLSTHRCCPAARMTRNRRTGRRTSSTVHPLRRSPSQECGEPDAHPARPPHGSPAAQAA
ncbi:MAG TPA: hypothetical protein VGC06_28395 [Actinomycetes bacterium]